MFENLRNAFREAVDNFREELSRDQVPETVDKLIVGMRDEVADAKVRVRELEDQIERARAEAAREARDAETARRRGEMAARIDDEETARVALQYAEKHGERKALLEKKIEALEQELAYRRDEVEEMIGKVKEAQRKRDALAATAGRSDARESLNAADDLFDELDRMAEKIDDEEARGEAARDLGDIDLAPGLDDDVPPRPDEPLDVDARLAELKRRMGKS